MEYQNRLYTILYPNNALIASQMDPEHFAKHYTSGSSRHYSGKVIFAEIDVNYRNDYFCIEEQLKKVRHHSDGRPKATKFISTYRVLENLSIDSFKKLYLTTPEGYVLGLESAPHDAVHEEGSVRVYAEISPMNMLVLSEFNFPEFGTLITDPANPKHAPKQLYTQLDINILEFLEEFEQNPFQQSPIRSIHPSTLRDSFYELKRLVDKHNKGLSLNCSMDEFSYKLIKHGFMIASQDGNRFFPIPPLLDIEKANFKFWRTM